MNDRRSPNQDKILRHFGDRLRAIRKQNGLSQEDLAEKAGFSRSYYTEVETGKRNVSLLNLHLLAEALDIELSDLLLSDSTQQLIEPRIPVGAGFINEGVLRAAGLTLEMVKGGITYSYSILDGIDQALLEGNASPLAKMVELANLSSILGNLLGAGVERASKGAFKRNAPHKYPDLVAKSDNAKDVEIKVALEGNKPKGHLAKAGYYLTYRYILGNTNGTFSPGNNNRGEVIYVWEARFGYLDLHHFNISNTAGDSGKTAVLNTAGMKNLTVVYCDLEKCPYSRTSRLYKEYEILLTSKLS